MRFRAIGSKVLVLVAVALALGACGSDDDTPATSPDPDPVTQVPEAPVLALAPQSVKTFRFDWADVSGEAEYRLLEDPDGTSGYSQVTTIAAGATNHEQYVYLPARINARYILQACNAAGCADSAPVNVSGSLAEAIGYVKASNTGASDSFGVAVALSASGQTMAVGAHTEDSAATGIDGDQADNSANDSGAVYVFVRGAGGWSQQAYIKASNADAGDFFGYTVALSADGNTLAVGAPNESGGAVGVGGDPTDNSMPRSGAVYVFTRNLETWSEQVYLKASNTGDADRFGVQVALSAGGDTLAVGAYFEDGGATGVDGDQADDSAPSAGAAYVFVRDNDTWLQQAYLKASNTGAADLFGASIALSGDGDTLAIGAPEEDSAATGIDGNQADESALQSGAVYVFVRSAGAWAQQAWLKASNTGAGDLFGASLGLSSDGGTLAVGAHGEGSSATGVNGDQTDDSAASSGAAYVFSRSSGTWTQQAYLKASNAQAGDQLGFGLAIAADGNRLAVSAPLEDSSAPGIDGDQTDDSATRSGAVYVFGRSAGSWSQESYVKASVPGAGDTFGGNITTATQQARAVALAADGQTLAVGARSEDSAATGIGGDASDNSVSNSGAVYLY